jgi:glycerate kinase
MRISTESVVVQAPECLTADVADEAVVMTGEPRRYIALNAFGKHVWGLAATPRRVDELCIALAADYDAEGATLTQDVVEFLDRLLDEGLLVIDERAAD